MRVVNTDNFGGDYPDESWVGPPDLTEAEAKALADKLNGPADANATRYYKVVANDYRLQPGFEP